MVNVKHAPAESQAKRIVLPDFDAPPINEVVCGVQFDGLDRWQTVHFGLFWQRVRKSYPKFEDQNPLRLLESPESGKPTETSTSVLPLRRVWLVDETNRYVMQVDPPRLLHNWRKRGPSDPYPRFEDAYSRFTSCLDSFRSFVEDSSLGEIRPRLYELSYINHIVGDEVSPARPLESFLSFYQWKEQRAFLGEPSKFQCTLEIPLAKDAGKLSVSVKHGVRKPDGKAILVLDLTARGSAKLDMNDWFDVAHETIVRGFVDITTSEAQALWSRRV